MGIDFFKYVNRVLEINPERKRARVSRYDAEARLEVAAPYSVAPIRGDTHEQRAPAKGLLFVQRLPL